MTKFRFLHAGALGALTSVLLITSLPVEAQDRGGPRRGGSAERVERQSGGQRQGSWAPREARGNGGERPTISARQSSAPQASGQRPDRSPVARAQGDNRAGRYEGRGARAAAPAATVAPARGTGYSGERNASYTAPRDRSYGANARTGNWASQRQARDGAAQQQRSGGTWARSDDRRDASRQNWGSRSADYRRAERRDDARNYANGYRDGRRDDNRWDNNRYGNNHRRWDNRGWRNDNRYDWLRYRAANRSLFSLGRYYSPYRNYSYSRINIGFRLGSLFYSNRYWINDPWQYRLPAAYGPYRWIRYYDDALLVDTYTGEVVDVIHDFFW